MRSRVPVVALMLVVAASSLRAEPPEELVAQKTVTGREVPYFVCVLNFLVAMPPDDQMQEILTFAVKLNEIDARTVLDARRSFEAQRLESGAVTQQRLRSLEETRLSEPDQWQVQANAEFKEDFRRLVGIVDQVYADLLVRLSTEGESSLVELLQGAFCEDAFLSTNGDDFDPDVVQELEAFEQRFGREKQ